MRMIAQETDGFSIGLINEGVMSGEYMMSFVTLQLSAIQRSDNLLECINYWWVKCNELTLITEDWFKKG